ncbi:MAG TPA: tRNA (adenine-N1)-methyltransferase [Anaerolineae bacterium]|nr:tRNA (adenine-N1)-methyltransferase [Anaerolineae bacterium]
MRIAQAGDLALFVSQAVKRRGEKRFLVRLKPNEQLHTHRGIVAFDDCIGQAWGRYVQSHLGHPFLILEPSTAELIRDIKRTTQIVFPKDVGYIVMKLSIQPGITVIEAGTGSGGLTLALARIVGATGRVISYEARPEMQHLARKNLEKVGLADRVEFKLKDIALGFDEADADALFLDVPEPAHYLGQAAAALRGGGFFGTIVPTANQVTRLLETMSQQPFGMIEVEELLMRAYKTVAERLRPTDRMVAHTGYLLFARKIEQAAHGLSGLDADAEDDQSEAEDF